MPIITKTPAYKVGDGAFFTVEEAKKAAITILFEDCYAKLPESQTPMSMAANVHEAISGMILDHADELVAILTCKPEDEKPARKPRSDKGTKRAKAEAVNRALQDGEQ